MGYGNCIVANDAPENREVAGPDALYFEAHQPETLTSILTSLLEPGLAASLRPHFTERAARLYSWDRVREQYEEMFARMDRQRRS